MIRANSLFPAIRNQRIQSMDQARILSEIQSLDNETPNTRLRYVQIQLEQGQLGRNLNCILEQCTRTMRARKASNEYIQAVFEQILAQMQSGKVEEAIAIRAVWRLVYSVRNCVPYFSADRRALEIIMADAIERLPAHA